VTRQGRSQLAARGRGWWRLSWCAADRGPAGAGARAGGRDRGAAPAGARAAHGGRGPPRAAARHGATRLALANELQGSWDSPTPGTSSSPSTQTAGTDAQGPQQIRRCRGFPGSTDDEGAGAGGGAGASPTGVAVARAAGAVREEAGPRGVAGSGGSLLGMLSDITGIEVAEEIAIEPPAQLLGGFLSWPGPYPESRLPHFWQQWPGGCQGSGWGGG